jgi:uncharacterized protein YidB (DUF937 family)
MGLFDQVVSGLESGDARHAALYAEVAKVVAQEGGVDGLAQKFEQNGVGGLIPGLLANGAAQPVSAPQAAQAVGPDKVTEIAQKTGLSESQVSEGISKFLPLIVSHLAPNGTAPAQSSDELGGALNLLKSKLFGS